MTDKTSLGDRMKDYEAVSQTKLMRRTPVIIRIDGRAFHTFTKRLKNVDFTMRDTPFSTVMHDVMVDTTIALVAGIQNCVFAYTQSDEISLLLRDYDELESQSWFGNNVQKMVSCSASLATAAFNLAYYADAYTTKPGVISDMAQFDSRVYTLPKEEVVNYFLWRQQDASRNSVQMLGRFHFTQHEMHGKNNSQVQDMLMHPDFMINWNDLPTWQKRGSCVYRTEHSVVRDEEIPIFSQDRDYVGKHLLTPEDQTELVNAMLRTEVNTSFED